MDSTRWVVAVDVVCRPWVWCVLLLCAVAEWCCGHAYLWMYAFS